jgi:hypothetical protein
MIQTSTASTTSTTSKWLTEKQRANTSDQIHSTTVSSRSLLEYEYVTMVQKQSAFNYMKQKIVI